MGSWHATCGISQIPITAGDKCKVFILVQRELYNDENYGGGIYYPNDIWYPRGTPISGKYNDYGGLEENSVTEDLSAKILLDSIKNNLASSKNRFIENLTAASLVDYVSQHIIKIYNSDKRSKLGLMFVHNDIYQSFISYDPLDTHHKKGGYLYRKRSDIIADDMMEWYNYCSSVIREKKDSREKMLGYLLSSNNKYNIFDSLRIGMDPPGYDGFSLYYDFLHKKMIEEILYEHEDVQNVASSLIEFTKFNWAMAEARRWFTPQVGKGSQSNALKLNKMIANTILEVCQRVEEEMSEYSDEESSDDWMLKHNEEELKRNNV